MGSAICISLFIKPARIAAGPVTLHGDGRDFSSNSDPAHSRGYAWISVGSDQVETHMNPSVYIWPASIVGHEAYEEVAPSANNKWTVTRGEDGEITVSYDLVVSGILDQSGAAPHINGEVTFRPDGASGYEYAFDRDGFPWAEAYYHDGQGNVRVIFQDPAVRGDPHDLFAIEPNISPQASLILAANTSFLGPPRRRSLDFICHPDQPC
jgi:hypothetical protein